MIVNFGSNKQVAELLYERLKLPVVLRTKSGAPSVSKEALILLALHANTEAQRKALVAVARYRRIHTYEEAAQSLAVTFGDDLQPHPGSGRLLKATPVKVKVKVKVKK